jgi:hypothetical protein
MKTGGHNTVYNRLRQSKTVLQWVTFSRNNNSGVKMSMFTIHATYAFDWRKALYDQYMQNHHFHCPLVKVAKYSVFGIYNQLACT